jgi:hypothetical protein
MTSTKLHDDFTDEPDFLQVSRDARLLHIEAIVYCNRMLTDGKISAPALRRITDSVDISASLNELIKAGLWHGTDDGQRQLDWTDQEKAENIIARRDERAAVQKRYREKVSEPVKRHNSGDHSRCDARYCKAREE